MTTHDAKDARCRIFTFKEGLLSAVAHDLEIDVQRFSVTVDGERVRATFDPSSLRVLHAMHDGVPRPGALSERERAKIEQTIRDEVLSVRRHPEVRFEAEARGAVLDGTLTLFGRSRPLRVPFRVEGTARVAEASLHQPDWGIAPYSAMLGTLKIKPDVRVRIELPG
jgi:hypothetical protein